ncbi:MAG: VOC family protein [Bacteroidia bacterium]
MLFKSKKKNTTVQISAPPVLNGLVWLEIPAANLKRAVSFYEKLLKIKMEFVLLYDRPTALFNKYETGFNGSIVEVKDHKGGAGIKPVLKVPVMHEALKTAKENGGQIVCEPFILKQKNSAGETVLGNNLIDRQIGYASEIRDSEGNYLMLYSHS